MRGVVGWFGPVVLICTYVLVSQFEDEKKIGFPNIPTS